MNKRKINNDDFKWMKVQVKMTDKHLKKIHNGLRGDVLIGVNDVSHYLRDR